MGAWGSGPFENDGALDWMNELVAGADLDEALRSAVTEAAYLDVDDGSRAFAAAEVVAAINGHPSRALPEELASHLSEHRMKPSKRRTTLALRALERVLADGSELKELWDEGRDRAWASSVRSLRRRLRAEPKPRVTKTRRARLALPEPRTVVDLMSPSGAYQLWIYENDSPAGANTQGMLTSFEHGSGSGLFMVMGTGLGLSARWRGENTLEISIPARLEVDWSPGAPERPIQFVDKKVKLVPRRT